MYHFGVRFMLLACDVLEFPECCKGRAGGMNRVQFSGWVRDLRTWGEVDALELTSADTQGILVPFLKILSPLLVSPCSTIVPSLASVPLCIFFQPSILTPFSHSSGVFKSVSPLILLIHTWSLHLSSLH